MSFIITPADPNYGGGGSGYSNVPQGQPAPTRHYVFGSLDQLQIAVHYLHVNRYADYRRWTPPQAIPPEGLIIPPTPRQLFICLEQTKRLG